ncbi:asparaginase [Haloferax sp. DFSO52]|uniref:asparaginase n=1 Tax=Haloferax sp. DFSO52 TaxID=3388505 RepID=UPI003A89726C
MTDATVVLLTMGGTIANPPERSGYISGGELVDSIPELDEIAEVTVKEVRSKASSSIDFDDWVALRDEIERVLSESSPDGIVVTLGSNTTAETAYFLELTVGTDVPIALTAAQRNYGTQGADGNRNLLDAVRTVATPDARERGVLVVVNDEIHAARDVSKLVSGRPDAWESSDFGPIGLVDKYGHVGFYRTPDRIHTDDPPFVPPSDGAAFPSVVISYAAVDDDGSMVDAAVERGVDGIVLAAFPTGAASKRDGKPDQRAALERAVEAGIPVVVSHRGTEGWPASTYLTDAQFIWGDTLTPSKARILLTLALCRTSDPSRIQTYFRRY